MISAEPVAGLPEIAPGDDLAALLATARGVEGFAAGEVLVVPDRHGSGTNALVLTPPDVLGPAFGPGSRERHEQRAREAGIAVECVSVSTLGLDVDTLDDLEALRTALEHVRGGASHTRGLLARVGRVGGR